MYQFGPYRSGCHVQNPFPKSSIQMHFKYHYTSSSSYYSLTLCSQRRSGDPSPSLKCTTSESHIKVNRYIIFLLPALPLLYSFFSRDLSASLVSPKASLGPSMKLRNSQCPLFAPSTYSARRWSSGFKNEEKTRSSKCQLNYLL